MSTADGKRVLITPSSVPNTMPVYLKTDDYAHGTVETAGVPGTGRIRSNELVLKIRIADGIDPDFIEVELPQTDLTYQTLIHVCCQELNVDPSHIVKLRKLPNTRLRKDDDVRRLGNFQEIEVVTNPTNVYKYTQSTNGSTNSIPATPVNGYQSISKKDQTILY
ncbi:ankyrin repeat domain-containing protein 40-like isoform X2 [Ceratina calcarata]|uniref:Ankyrin repeat domain-containing protein 40-like isoform X2 n=1 Tax=Ceratina calcarata TaxID=156304 RepID=A0AAJ7NBV1_9HYME|nr:ankyrin repeat domain-containing protein 40-like isoform X2 [Ceratina calcarata]